MKLTVDFSNKTQQAWTFAIYLTLPGQELDSVSWKQMAVAPSGTGAMPSWDSDDLVVAVGTHAGDPITYKTLLSTSAAPGSAWKIEPSGATWQLEADGSAQQPSQVQILYVNDTVNNVSPGLGVDGTGALFFREMPSGVSAVFDVDARTYWVEAFDTMVPGQVITAPGPDKTTPSIGTTLSIGPALLDFTQGTAAAVSLDLKGQTVELSVTYTGPPLGSMDRLSKNRAAGLRTTPTKEN